MKGPFISSAKWIRLAVLTSMLLFMMGCGQTPDPTVSTEPENGAKETAAIPVEDPMVEETDEDSIQSDEQAAEGSGQVHIVEIENFAFSPGKLEIKKGDKIIFKNKDSVKHSATADDGTFDTGLLAQDLEGQITFMTAGEFAYFCLPHPNMKGMIVVIE